jgi:hypothetical protein
MCAAVVSHPLLAQPSGPDSADAPIAGRGPDGDRVSPVL